NHLYALTLADIRATNNNLWNDWKSTLLRELYLMTSKALESGQTLSEDFQQRLQKHRSQALQLLQEQQVDADKVEAFWQRLENSYFVRFKPKQLAWHAKSILQAQQATDNEITLVE